jgi:23S rRNA pseudouridine955/2504/2580 synthase
VKVAQHGKPANTGFKVIQRFAEATLLEVILHSGRMHQIRVHTAYVKHPIAADDKYGDKVFNKTMRAKCKRLFLHASQIQFTCPLNQQKINVTAPLPKELRDCLDQLS